VLSAAQHGAYQRFTDEHLAVFHRNDPLACFTYRGPSPA